MLAPELAQRVNGRWVSEGRRRLRIVAASSKQAVVAAQLGVSESYVGMLLAGVRRPRHDVMARIWAVFGIAGHEWGLAPAPSTQRSVARDSSTSTSERGESVPMSNLPRPFEPRESRPPSVRPGGSENDPYGAPAIDPYAEPSIDPFAPLEPSYEPPPDLGQVEGP